MTDPKEIAEEIVAAVRKQSEHSSLLALDWKRAVEWVAAAIERDRAEREAWRPTHRHYKGGYYRQIATAGYSETGESLAIYDDDRGNLWARPLKIFVETLPNGQRRFEPLPSAPEGLPSSSGEGKSRPCGCG